MAGPQEEPARRRFERDDLKLRFWSGKNSLMGGNLFGDIFKSPKQYEDMRIERRRQAAARKAEAPALKAACPARSESDSESEDDEEAGTESSASSDKEAETDKDSKAEDTPVSKTAGLRDEPEAAPKAPGTANPNSRSQASHPRANVDEALALKLANPPALHRAPSIQVGGKRPSPASHPGSKHGSAHGSQKRGGSESKHTSRHGSVHASQVSLPTSPVLRGGAGPYNGESSSARTRHRQARPSVPPSLPHIQTLRVHSIRPESSVSQRFPVHSPAGSYSQAATPLGRNWERVRGSAAQAGWDYAPTVVDSGDTVSPDVSKWLRAQSQHENPNGSGILHQSSLDRSGPERPVPSQRQPQRQSQQPSHHLTQVPSTSKQIPQGQGLQTRTANFPGQGTFRMSTVRYQPEFRQSVSPPIQYSRSPVHQSDPFGPTPIEIQHRQNQAQHASNGAVFLENPNLAWHADAGVQHFNAQAQHFADQQRQFQSFQCEIPPSILYDSSGYPYSIVDPSYLY